MYRLLTLVLLEYKKVLTKLARERASVYKLWNKSIEKHFKKSITICTAFNITIKYTG